MKLLHSSGQRSSGVCIEIWTMGCFKVKIHMVDHGLAVNCKLSAWKQQGWTEITEVYATRSKIKEVVQELLDLAIQFNDGD